MRDHTRAIIIRPIHIINWPDRSNQSLILLLFVATIIICLLRIDGVHGAGGGGSARVLMFRSPDHSHRHGRQNDLLLLHHGEFTDSTVRPPPLRAVDTENHHHRHNQEANYYMNHDANEIIHHHHHHHHHQRRHISSRHRHHHRVYIKEEEEENIVSTTTRSSSSSSSSSSSVILSSASMRITAERMLKHGQLSNRRGDRGQTLVGSVPPKCLNQCGGCTPCRGMLVPVHNFKLNINDQYYPETWKCLCKGKIFKPT